MRGKRCFYDDTFECFRFVDCKFENLMACLKVATGSLTRELSSLKHRQMLKHTKASLSWRNSSFYYKKRAKKFEDKLKEFGIDIGGTI